MGTELPSSYSPGCGMLGPRAQAGLRPLNGGVDVATKDFGTNGKGVTAAKRSAVGKGMDAAFRGYINLNISADEKAKYKKWADPQTVFSVFSAQVADGVNVAIKPDPKADGFLASATQRRETSVNAGLCVTARASDPVEAFGRLMYVLGILSRTESWEATQPIADPDRW